MPFTLAHPLAILPFKKWADRYSLFLALVIGSTTPDMVYFLPHALKTSLVPLYGHAISRSYTHSWIGLFTFCVPIGLVLFFLFRFVLGPTVYSLLPDFFQKRFGFLKAPLSFDRSWKRIGMLFFFLLLGASTHSFWDAWTSRGGFFVQTFPSLAKWTLFMGRGPMPIFGIIYYISSAIGLLGVSVFFLRWFLKEPLSPLSPQRLARKERHFAFSFIILFPTIAGFWQGWVVGYPFDGFYRIKYFVFSFMLTFLFLSVILWGTWGFLWKIHSYFPLFPTEENKTTQQESWKKILKVTSFFLFGLFFLGVLFVLNTNSFSWKFPYKGHFNYPILDPKQEEITLMAFNIAHCNSRKSKYQFNPKQKILTCIDQVAELIRKEKPQLVFLSEIDIECTPCNVRQLREIAKKSKMPFYVGGENYNFGFPFYRIRSGVAILSQFKLYDERVVQLPGKRPFYKPHGNRRVLWAHTFLQGKKVKLASIHNESYDPANNEKQVEVLLKEAKGYFTIIAGDFNALPGWKAMQKFKNFNIFTAQWDCEPTFPAHKPTKCIDNILVPKSWQLIQQKVISTQLSDHLPVVAKYKIRF